MVTFNSRALEPGDKDHIFTIADQLDAVSVELLDLANELENEVL